MGSPPPRAGQVSGGGRRMARGCGLSWLSKFSLPADYTLDPDPKGSALDLHTSPSHGLDTRGDHWAKEAAAVLKLEAGALEPWSPGHGRPVPQLRVGPHPDRLPDRPHAERVLWLPGSVVGAGGQPGAEQPHSGPDVQPGDPGLLYSPWPSLHDGLHSQCSYLCSWFVILHPSRETVFGLHCHSPLLPPPGMLDLQFPFPFITDLVAGTCCLYCPDGCDWGVPLYEDRAQGDPS
ncbi:protein SYS1 homolog isoform X1 [Vombatus ursinus]|uniref:protein SYS1 homolog isoform X1 n=1 Tax=Vombatus ursinus TaxID=29139 RepID=UPI000FFD3F10|nr:protein SYS1 homolog isoform X1 [Vombatus ursinus]